MSEIVRIELDIERLGESVVGLSESGQFFPPNPSLKGMSELGKRLSRLKSIMVMKFIVLDEFKEELGESKTISLVYEDGLDELFIQLGESQSECSYVEGGLDELFIQLGESDAD